MPPLNGVPVRPGSANPGFDVLGTSGLAGESGQAKWGSQPSLSRDSRTEGRVDRGSYPKMEFRIARIPASTRAKDKPTPQT